MGKPANHKKVKIVVGFIFADAKPLAAAEDVLQRKFGPADFYSNTILFDYTDYYEREMGQCLKRKFISFRDLISAEKLQNIKLITNAIEKKLSECGRRRVNIDPGYLTDSKVVLFTTKDYCHRVYLGRGIYAEPALSYKNGTFVPPETAYPDYKSAQYIDIFNTIRDIYLKQMGKK